jgi:hypothetical protein
MNFYGIIFEKSKINKPFIGVDFCSGVRLRGVFVLTGSGVGVFTLTGSGLGVFPIKVRRDENDRDCFLIRAGVGVKSINDVD